MRGSELEVIANEADHLLLVAGQAETQISPTAVMQVDVVPSDFDVNSLRNLNRAKGQ